MYQEFCDISGAGSSLSSPQWIWEEEIEGSSQCVIPNKEQWQNLEKAKGRDKGDLDYEGDLSDYECGEGVHVSHDENDNQIELEPAEDKGGDNSDTERACHEIQMQVGNQLSDYEPESDYESFQSSSDESERNFFTWKDDPKWDEMNPKLSISMKFASVNQFQKCLRHYAVNKSFDLKVYLK